MPIKRVKQIERILRSTTHLDAKAQHEQARALLSQEEKNSSGPLREGLVKLVQDENFQIKALLNDYNQAVAIQTNKFNAVEFRKILKPRNYSLFKKGFVNNQETQDCYRELHPFMILYSHIETPYSINPLRTYKLSMTFADANTVHDYLEYYLKKNGQSIHPVMDAASITLPDNARWNIELWQHLAGKYYKHDGFFRALACADKIERLQQNLLQDKEKFEPIKSYFVKKEKQAFLNKKKQQCSEEYDQAVIASGKMPYKIEEYIHQEIEKSLKKFKSRPAFFSMDASALKSMEEKIRAEVSEKAKKDFQKVNAIVKQTKEEFIQENLLHFEKRFDANQKNIENTLYAELTQNLQQLSLEHLILLADLSGYARAFKNLEAAAVLSELQIPEKDFNKYLRLLKKPGAKNSDDQLPNILLDGADYGYPGFYLSKLSSPDPKAAFLGYPTGCCQSIGSDGESCAVHGVSSGVGGFYVLCQGKPPAGLPGDTTFAINSRRIIAQTWAWRQQDVVVFDTVEVSGPSHETLEQRNRTRILFKILAQKICDVQKEIKKVNVGHGGLGLGYVLEEKPAPLKGYSGYRESQTQYKVYDSQYPFYNTAFIFPQETLKKIKAEKTISPHDVSILFNIFFQRGDLWCTQFIQILDLEQRRQLIQNEYRNPFNRAIKANYVELVTELLPDVDLTKEDKNGNYPLMVAIKNKTPLIIIKKIIEQLIKNKQLTEVNRPDFSGNTGFHHAIYNNDFALASELLKVPGIDITQANKSLYLQQTPLIIAAGNGNIDLVILILNKLSEEKQTTQVNRQDVLGDTALHKAVRLGKTAIVAELLNLSAINIDIENQKGQKAFEHTKTYEMEKLFKDFIKQQEVRKISLPNSHSLFAPQEEQSPVVIDKKQKII